MNPINWRTFGQRPFGRIILVLAAIAAVVGSLMGLGGPASLTGLLVAIIAILLFGAAVPIYFGWRSIRQLALVGLGVLLISAGITAPLYASELRLASPAESTLNGAPYGIGGPAVDNARVTPFTGAEGASYTFSATIEPQYFPANSSAHFLLLVVTDCPGALTNNSPNCPSPYQFFEQNHTISPNLTAPTPVAYAQSLPGADIWWWNLGLGLENASGLSVQWLYLDNNPAYLGDQGPVSGNYASTVELVLPGVYVVVLLYPGSVYFVGLLVYLFLKRREAKRRGGSSTAPSGASSGTPTAPGSGPSAPATPATAAAGDPSERRCPNCQAVVYPNETSCWKCGKSLAPPTSAHSAPLPSSKN